jgi:hypothetical protein
MEGHTEGAELEPFEVLVGTWTTEATHQELPGAAIRGQSTFEWLGGRRFLIWRSHYDHPEIPDAIAIMGMFDGEPSMRYFDSRGVHRVLAVSVSKGTWQYSHDGSDFSHRFSGTFSDDGNTITGQSQISEDSSTWEDDLAITYRRAL